MRVFYFSGTGNTEILAKDAAKFFSVEAESIETVKSPLLHEDFVIIFYPVYGSLPPVLVREWVKDYLRAEHKVCVASIVSQMCFSGDGAMAIEPYLPKNVEIVHARHINMPNNISNFPVLRIGTESMIRRKISRARRKLKKELERIRDKNYRKKGCSKFWKFIGDMQRKPFLRSESELFKKVFVNDKCIECGKCVRICPRRNLEIRQGKAQPLGKCTLCLRCMYNCPVKAIAVLRESFPEKIYKPVL